MVANDHQIAVGMLPNLAGLGVSIHAPAKGGDMVQELFLLVPKKFRSTPPKGVTRRPSCSRWRLLRFDPRPR